MVMMEEWDRPFRSEMIELLHRRTTSWIQTAEEGGRCRREKVLNAILCYSLENPGLARKKNKTQYECRWMLEWHNFVFGYLPMIQNNEASHVSWSRQLSFLPVNSVPNRLQKMTQ